jgi:DNA-binding transcriptional LysR family regulator
MAKPDWNLYRSFLAVVRARSLCQAARHLDLTQPTVGRHIETLEQTLGVALFTRSPSGLAPTSAALDLIQHAETIEAAAEALVRAASGERAEEHGTVRVTASEVIGAEALPSMLASFRQRWPRIDVELALSNRTHDLLRREADIAVRHIRPAQESLVSRRIGTIAIGLYAHRRYIQLHGFPKTLEEAFEHTLIGWDQDQHATRLAASVPGLGRDRFALRSDSDLAQLAMVRAGLGIGACQVPIANRDPELTPVLADIIRFDLDVWLAMHQDLRASRRVRLLFDHLAATLSGWIKHENGSPARE